MSQSLARDKFVTWSPNARKLPTLGPGGWNLMYQPVCHTERDQDSYPTSTLTRWLDELAR